MLLVLWAESRIPFGLLPGQNDQQTNHQGYRNEKPIVETVGKDLNEALDLLS
jgi:hypothetical protein